MYLNKAADIVAKANAIVQKTGSRDAEKIASQLGIIILSCNFSKQKGVYKVIKRDRFIFVKKEALTLQKFNIFDVRGGRMEYEANSFPQRYPFPIKIF